MRRGLLRVRIDIVRDPKCPERFSVAWQSELEPEELSTLPPRALSFWLGSLFHDSQLQQQELLEVRCCWCCYPNAAYHVFRVQGFVLATAPSLASVMRVFEFSVWSHCCDGEWKCVMSCDREGLVGGPETLV